MRNAVCCFTALAGALILGLAWAADFTQVERDAKFIKDSRRQDKTLKSFFGDMVPGEIEFGHRGSYRVVVHREGLDRSTTLVPVRAVPFADLEALRSAARSEGLVVGVLSLTYGHPEPLLEPGSILLVYDGLNVELHNVHGYLLGELVATLAPPPDVAEVDPALGSPEGTGTSLANITPEGGLELYLQLTAEDGTPLRGDEGFVKVLVSFSIPGIVTDDDSPWRELAQPKDDEQPESAAE